MKVGSLELLASCVKSLSHWGLVRLRSFAELHQKPPKTKMTMEHPPFEDVCPIEMGHFPLPC